jgi:hypothetical protein
MYPLSYDSTGVKPFFDRFYRNISACPSTEAVSLRSVEYADSLRSRQKEKKDE